MGGKTAIALGLVLGVVAGAGLLVAALLLAPAPSVPAPTRPPLATLPPPTASPVDSEAPSGSTTGAPSASPSAAASTAASPGASGGAGNGATPVPLFGVGDPAPALVVTGLDGGTVDLASYRGKPVWVNFMATWCLPCRDELPLMAGFQARYAGDGLEVLLVDEREDAATVRSFLSGLDVSLPAAVDGNGSALADWGALALPVHFWVDANGVIQDAALGGIGPDVMARGLARILPGVTVTP